MNKKELIDKAKDDLRILGTEERFHGFPEFAQFSEETLRNILPYVSIDGLKWLIKEIEDTSYLGIEKARKLIDGE